MIEEPTEMWMWEKIDGTIGPDDETRLDAILKQDAEAREHYAELVRFGELLGGVEELEPPTALRRRIEGAIDFDRYAARHESATPRKTFGWIPWRFDLRLALATAAGVLIGLTGYHFAVYRPGSTGSFDRTTAVGTIGQAQGGLAIDLDGIRGHVRFYEDASRATSQIELASDREIELRLEYGGRSIDFHASGDTDNPLRDISVSDSGIVAKSRGSVGYVATFEREGSRPLRVRIVSDGDVLFDKEVRPGHSR